MFVGKPMGLGEGVPNPHSSIPATERPNPMPAAVRADRLGLEPNRLLVGHLFPSVQGENGSPPW